MRHAAYSTVIAIRQWHKIMAKAKPHKITIQLDQVGRGKCFIDGNDISNIVSSIEFHAKVGDLTDIRLTLTAEVEIEAQASLSGHVLSDDDITSLADEYRRRRVSKTHAEA
jgi:hypothetical protein